MSADSPRAFASDTSSLVVRSIVSCSAFSATSAPFTISSFNVFCASAASSAADEKLLSASTAVPKATTSTPIPVAIIAPLNTLKATDVVLTDTPNVAIVAAANLLATAFAFCTTDICPNVATSPCSLGAMSDSVDNPSESAKAD